MNTTLAVARREFRAFFNSPVAYVVLGAFLLVAGWLYFGTLFLASQASLRGFFEMAPFLFVLLIPAISMRLLAEERKSGTIELMLTLPVRDWELVAGKFFAALGMVAVGLLFTLPYALTVSRLIVPGIDFDWGPVVGGYVGLILMAASFVALGLWASAMTRNQIIGFIVALVLCFFFWGIGKFAVLLPEAAASVFQFLSVDYHFDNISRGVIDSRDVFFYLSLIVGGLVLTTRSLATARR